MSSPYFSDLNAFTEPLVNRLRSHMKRVVFTEGEDVRVLRVAERLLQLEVVVPILLGNQERISAMAKEAGVDLTFVGIIDPSKANDLDLFVERFERIEGYKGKKVANARETVTRAQMYGGMMVQYGYADTLVGGNQVASGAFYRAMSRTIKRLPEVESLFTVVAAVGNDHLKNMGRDGFLFLADCGLIPQPTPKELACVAVETGHLAAHYFGRRPRVAMLSHSTHGSNATESSKRVVSALALARQHSKVAEMDLEGEMQADVALCPKAAEVKLNDSAGEKGADVLVFPNLDSAHISMKLLSHVAGAQCYGHFVMGLARPVAQVPMTASEESIFGTACLAAIEAVKFHELYPQGRGLLWS